MENLMFTLAVAGAISATVAFCVNRALGRTIGEARAALAAPFTEEIIKTMPAVLLAVPLIPAHLLFGLIESVYDLARAGSRRAGYAAALASLVGHGAFGGATAGVARMTGSLAAGLLAGITLHFMWNLMVAGGVRDVP